MRRRCFMLFQGLDTLAQGCVFGSNRDDFVLEVTELAMPTLRPRRASKERHAKRESPLPGSSCGGEEHLAGGSLRRRRVQGKEAGRLRGGEDPHAPKHPRPEPENASAIFTHRVAKVGRAEYVFRQDGDEVKTLWIATVALSTLAGCGSTSDTTGTSSGSAGAGCKDFSAVKTGMSFATDVMPIFQTSCNFSSCHGSASSSPMEGLALGSPNGVKMSPEEIKAVRTGIVSAPAERSSLSMVEAGKPTLSFLLAKISYSDFAQCEAVGSTCEPKGCGTRMPLSSPALDPAAVDTVAGWIQDGALDN